MEWRDGSLEENGDLRLDPHFSGFLGESRSRTLAELQYCNSTVLGGEAVFAELQQRLDALIIVIVPSDE